MTPCKTRALGCKLDGLHPTLQRWHRTRTAPTPGTRCHHERAVRVVRDGPFACWAMCSEHMQGDAWGTSVARARAAPPERGRAYGARARGSRSPRRSGRWGQPITWRRGTGRRQVQGAGCERHTSLHQGDAAHWRAACDRKTHEPFGEGPLAKYPQGPLAGGLLYRKSGSQRGA